MVAHYFFLEMLKSLNHPVVSEDSVSASIKVLNTGFWLHFRSRHLMIVFLAALFHLCLCDMRGLLGTAESERGLHGEGQE